MKLLIFIVLFVLCFIIYHVWKFRNPYKLIMVFGKKGAGKSTLIAKLVCQYNKKGRPCYTTEPVPGAYLFDPKRLGLDAIEPEAVIFVDEVGLVWHSRDFKSFEKHTRSYFKLQRHYHHTVYLFSQSFDCDKVLRDLCDQMYLIKNFFNCFSLARRINKKITIVHAGKEGSGESHLADDMEFDPLIFFWCGAVKITYIPRYARLFDSFKVPALADADYQYIPVPKIPTLRERIRMLRTMLPFFAACFRQALRARMHALFSRFRWRK